MKQTNKYKQTNNKQQTINIIEQIRPDRQVKTNIVMTKMPTIGDMGGNVP